MWPAASSRPPDARTPRESPPSSAPRGVSRARPSDPASFPIAPRREARTDPSGPYRRFPRAELRMGAFQTLTHAYACFMLALSFGRDSAAGSCGGDVAVAKDRRGRRRQPNQGRGLCPLYPPLPRQWTSKALRVAMSQEDWVRFRGAGAERRPAGGDPGTRPGPGDLPPDRPGRHPLPRPRSARLDRLGAAENPAPASFGHLSRPRSRGALARRTDGPRPTAAPSVVAPGWEPGSPFASCGNPPPEEVGVSW